MNSPTRPVSRLLRALLPTLAALGIASLSCQAAKPVPTRDGLILPLKDGFLKVELRAENIVRVAFAKDQAFLSRESLVVLPAPAQAPTWSCSNDDGVATLSTAKIKVLVDLQTGAVKFVDTQNRLILAEKTGSRDISPISIQGENTSHVRQEWESNAGEALYGLGQRQLGILNIKGYDLDLWQRNTTVIIPYLVSNRGYGILWDNTSYTRFGDLREPAPISAAKLFNAKGEPGGLSAYYYADPRFEKLVAECIDKEIDHNVRGLDQEAANTKLKPGLPPGDVSVRWEGFIQSDVSGIHSFHTYGDGGLKLWVDEKLLINHWRQDWLPADENVRVELKAGQRHHLRIEWVKDQKATTLSVRLKTPSASDASSLWSEVGDCIDYTFVYGPEIDQVIAGYRQVTGQAPLMPQWSFGLWQSRQRYKTAQESLDVIDGFRKRQIPFDTIVQDWMYWKADGWGSHEFDATRFPDPDAWIRSIHEKHARVMISVWAKFYKGTANFDEMQKLGYLYQPNLIEGQKDWLGYAFSFYDAFNSNARKLFWARLDKALFQKGIDAWWMDASEPDLLSVPTLEGHRRRMNPTAMGSGARMLNAFPLMNARGIYEGQRASAPDQRVFNLTRSGFAGMQRYAAAVWSGDTSSTWTAMQKQIPAGLGFSVSGMPYWTMDCGGFSVPQRFYDQKPADAEEWRELNTRWFQWATFTPILRVHGEEPNREVWEMGGENHPAYKTIVSFDRLRYRLLPYIYSLAGAVTHEGGTLMRPLVMDFRQDAKVLDLTDQYMFGPALLVNPILHYKDRSRQVYLPETAGGWYDFWTGALLKAGQTIEAPAPFETLPLYVRAGSLIPYGPELQYTGEKPADPITLYVFTGADGSFSLYEDDGLSYGYEKGAFTRIPLRWNEATRTLSIGQREGSFPGMLAKRSFQIVLVEKNKPVGFSFDAKPDRSLSYDGAAVEAKF